MRRRRHDASERESVLTRVDTWVKVVGGVVSLVLLFAGLPRDFANRLGHSDAKVAAATRTLQALEARVAATGPVLDISYVFLASDVIPTRDLDKGSRAGLLLAYPEQINRYYVGPRSDTPPRACRLGVYANTSIAYLVIENRGRRDATGITLTGRSLRLHRPVPMNESPDAGGVNYVARLEAAASATRPASVRVPLTLAPGDGIRIPLWSSGSPGAWDQQTHWCVFSRTAFEPRSVRYVDPILRSNRRMAVRRMRDPVLLANGIVGRG